MLVKTLISYLEYPVDVIAINAFDADQNELYIPFDGFKSEEIPDRIFGFYSEKLLDIFQNES